MLFYVESTIERSVKQINHRVNNGGHGETIELHKIEKTNLGSKLTFRTLTGVDFNKISEQDMQRVYDALEKTQNTIENSRNFLDYFIRIENI